jgi:hypothetical protein
MKKILMTAFIALTLFSCQNEENVPAKDQAVAGDTISARRACATEEVFERQLRENPELALKMNIIEDFTARAMQTNKLVNGKIQIPVVVNVLYRTAAENISLTQIQSQINVLNKDFTATNSDFNQVPAAFSGLKANVGITFVLDAVYRKATTKTSWGTNDSMKKTASGGLNPTSATTKLNLWVCTIGGGILGYAQFPGGSSATDGVVIDAKYFGLSGTANYPYNLGRTATHEVGHWLNLRHIWGDTACGNDYVADTPAHNTANYGAPVYPHYSTCAGHPIEMTMNYMDYTDDRAMFMFSNGQKSRINAIFASGGPRFSFAQP